MTMEVEIVVGEATDTNGVKLQNRRQGYNADNPIPTPTAITVSNE